MTWGFDNAALLAGGYALLLAGLAAVLEALGRRSHGFAERFHVAGFRYDAERDLWHCPEDRQLFRIASELPTHTATYRAPAHVCNACRARPDCTDSDEGRQIERQLDSWMKSELRRFHRGITVVLLGVAAVVLLWQMDGPGSSRDRLFLACLLTPLALVELRLLTGLLGHSQSTNAAGPRPE